MSGENEGDEEKKGRKEMRQAKGRWRTSKGGI